MKCMNNTFDKSQVEIALKRIEEYDCLTYKHCIRVANLTSKFCKIYHYDSNSSINIYYGALLHDIGKIYISKDILNKKGKLSYDEFEKIKKHPKDGIAIIDEMFNTCNIPKETLQIIGWHHTAYDGIGGYPDNCLFGENIPEYVRLVTIADVFDAISQDRPYSTAKSKTETLKIMQGMTRLDLHMLSNLQSVLLPKEYNHDHCLIIKC